MFQTTNQLQDVEDRQVLPSIQAPVQDCGLTHQGLLSAGSFGTITLRATQQATSVPPEMLIMLSCVLSLIHVFMIFHNPKQALGPSEEGSFDRLGDEIG